MSQRPEAHGRGPRRRANISDLLPDEPDRPTDGRERRPTTPKANSEAAKLWSENRQEYNRRVGQIVEESWEAADAHCAEADAASAGGAMADVGRVC